MTAPRFPLGTEGRMTHFGSIEAGPASGLPAELQAMVDHIERCQGVFKPSAFWNHFDRQNTEQLLRCGIGNFKRTVNQNYFNWLPTTPSDNQFRALLRLTADYPDAQAFAAEIDDSDAFVESLFDREALAARSAKDIYRLFVGMLWSYTRQTAANGLPDALDEPDLGNPIPIRLGGRRISQDLANSIRERNAILSMAEPALARGQVLSVVEIGAGYGRLGHVIMSSSPCRYAIVDIPPALYLSQWYLTQLFPQKSTFRFEPWTDWGSVADKIKVSELIFLTPDQFERMPDGYFDIGVAISNLAEMTPEQVARYLYNFDAKIRSDVYIKQWIRSENVLDQRVYVQADFDMPTNWIKALDRTDAVQDQFFETLWRRSPQWADASENPGSV
jgi:putative sugar O-methyltransferase